VQQHVVSAPRRGCRSCAPSTARDAGRGGRCVMHSWVPCGSAGGHGPAAVQDDQCCQAVCRSPLEAQMPPGADRV
jgi:hypothetical protein